MNAATLNKDAFAGQVAVVTGGTSGIGAATAQHLAELGARVYALGLGADRITFADDLDITVVELDVTDRAATDIFFEGIDQLDILVPAAGVTLGEAEQTPDGFAKVIDINLLSVQYFCVKAADLLARSYRGSIVLIASMLSTFGSAAGPAYSASKGGIVQLTKSLAQVHAPNGVRVNAVAPGWIQTAIIDQIRDTAPEMLDAVVARTPMDRLGNAREIATGIAFLCSDDASFITGVVLPIDGGYLTV